MIKKTNKMTLEQRIAKLEGFVNGATIDYDRLESEVSKLSEAIDEYNDATPSRQSEFRAILQELRVCCTNVLNEINDVLF